MKDADGTTQNPVGIPMMVNPGNHPNPHVLYGQDDITPYPVTFRRFLNWPGMQLRTGVDGIAMHKLSNLASSYRFGQVPRSPGLSRVQAQNPADVVPRSAAPQQWDAHVARMTGNQPTAPGGPGMYVGGSGFFNPGSGA